MLANPNSILTLTNALIVSPTVIGCTSIQNAINIPAIACTTPKWNPIWKALNDFMSLVITNAYAQATWHIKSIKQTKVLNSIVD
jgi:hypothetical protein